MKRVVIKEVQNGFVIEDEETNETYVVSNKRSLSTVIQKVFGATRKRPTSEKKVKDANKKSWKCKDCNAANPGSALLCRKCCGTN